MPLSTRDLDPSFDTVIYIVQPRIHYMKLISQQILKALNKPGASQKPKKFVLYLAPRKTLICEKVLRETGISIPENLILRELPLDLYCFDSDLITMELPSAYSECLLDGDLSSLYYIAKSMMKIQAHYGLFPEVISKGDLSTSVARMMLRMQMQMVGGVPNKQVFSDVPDFHQLILLDRTVDLISPLLTQHTYEGLIDEFFGIDNGIFTPNFEPCIPDKEHGRSILLNSRDNIFKQTRDLFWGYVGKALNKVALDVKERESKRKDLQSVEDIKFFTTKLLPQLRIDKRLLEIHINIMQQIKLLAGRRDFRKTVESEQNIINGVKMDEVFKYIEECIYKKDPITKILRLLMIASIINNGIPPKKYTFFRNEIVQTYGFEFLLTLNNLDKLNLLCKKGKNINYTWKTLASQLNVLDPEKEDELDIHQVYGGLSPLSIEVLKRIAESSWDENLENLLKKLPGRYMRYTQSASAPPLPNSKKIILVFVIGGITMAEISALRYLNQTQQKYEFYIATTKLINGGTFIKSMFEQVNSPLRRIRS